MLSTWLLRSGLLAVGLVIWFSNLDYRRLIKPDEVAAAIAFLISEDAGAITGQVLCVDGGASA